MFSRKPHVKVNCRFFLSCHLTGCLVFLFFSKKATAVSTFANLFYKPSGRFFDARQYKSIAHWTPGEGISSYSFKYTPSYFIMEYHKVMKRISSMQSN